MESSVQRVVAVSNAGGGGVLGAAGFLPMPLQGMLVQEAKLRVARAGNEELACYPTGQVVGMTSDERDCKTIVFDMINDYIEAVERLNKTLENA